MIKKITLTIFMIFIVVMAGCENQVNIIEIDAKNLDNYYLEQMSEDGAYLIYGSNNQKAIAFVSSKFQINDTMVDISDNVLSVHYYTTDKSVDGASLYKDVYLINDNVDVDDIKVYLNDKESYFVNTIISDKKIAH